MNVLVSILFLFVSSAVFASEDLPGFAQVNAQIYRGGRPTDDGLVRLKNLGVKTDLNLQGGDLEWSDPIFVEFMRWWEPGETPENIAHEQETASRLHLAFVHQPLNAVAEVTSEEDAEIDRALQLLATPSALPVYVHCEHGHDRTGLVIALYRVKYEGYSPDEAHAEWAAMGHSGVGAYFTGNLDTYFYEKAAQLTQP